MKFYSEDTKKLYDTEDALKAAEVEYRAEQKKKEEEAAEKKRRADEVTNAYSLIGVAQDKFEELKAQFITDYGAFHMTYREGKPIKASTLGGMCGNVGGFSPFAADVFKFLTLD